MIEAEQLRKSFGKTVAIDGVSFRAETGKITGLLGPNGAGKSTTLRILYTVLKPDAGRARIDGLDVVRDASAVRARLGVLPHGAGLYPHLSARENIRYYGRMHGLDPEVVERRIEDMVEVLEMETFVDRRTKGFSQGQRTRVALARALVHDPSHVVLDEPTTGLDVMATRRLRQYIRQLRDEGRCVLLSTHVMQEVAAICDEVVVISEGRVKAQASLSELRGLTGESDLEEAFVRLIGEGEDR